METVVKRTPRLLTLLAVALAACSTDSPLPNSGPMSHQGGLMLSDLSQATDAQTLADLRQFTTRFHDLDSALAAQYGLLKLPPATAEDGCISDAQLGGMGYHYTRGNNLGDDAVTLLDPEFLVYAPTDAPRVDGVARTRLAAVEYFLPFSATWPARGDSRFVKAPTLHDFPTTSTLPDVAFTETTRFGGWMFHIWLWENNPDGMFENFNTSVPLCLGSSS
jgi:hypothetical protein